MATTKASAPYKNPTPGATSKQPVVPVKLQRTDVEGKPIQEYDLPYAQRILNVRHPAKGFKLADPAYKIVNGVITPVEIPAAVADTVIIN